MDPLFVIFEQHLFNFKNSDSDRHAFVNGVIQDYISYLSKHNIVIPQALRHFTLEELTNQIQTMLVKKIYGCLTIQKFRESLTPQIRKRAKSRYTRLRKANSA
jgi:hypothetical protein